MDVMGAEDQVHMGELFEDVFQFIPLLRHAAADADHKFWLSFFQLAKGSDVTVNFPLGVFPHRTRVV